MIPGVVATIGISVFSNTGNLKGAALSYGMQQAGRGAFSGDGLTIIRISNSISSIDAMRFWYI
jgi:hypothetical protein